MEGPAIKAPTLRPLGRGRWGEERDGVPSTTGWSGGVNTWLQQSDQPEKSQNQDQEATSVEAQAPLRRKLPLPPPPPRAFPKGVPQVPLPAFGKGGKGARGKGGATKP